MRHIYQKSYRRGRIVNLNFNTNLQRWLHDMSCIPKTVKDQFDIFAVLQRFFN